MSSQPLSPVSGKATAGKYTRDAPLQFLLNLDGGTFTSLTAISGKEKQIRSYPAPSDLNSPEIANMVPAILTIKMKNR